MTSDHERKQTSRERVFLPYRQRKLESYQDEESHPLVAKNASLQLASLSEFKKLHRPDQDTLVSQRLPQGAVALVGDGEDVR